MTTARTIAANPIPSSSHRYGPTSYRPAASATPNPARASVAKPPSTRSTITEPAIAPRACRCRRLTSTIRVASPPSEVGRSWPSAYDTSVGPEQSGVRLVHAARAQENLPSPGERQQRADQDRVSEQQKERARRHAEPAATCARRPARSGRRRTTRLRPVRAQAAVHDASSSVYGRTIRGGRTWALGCDDFWEAHQS